MRVSSRLYGGLLIRWSQVRIPHGLPPNSAAAIEAYPLRRVGLFCACCFVDCACIFDIFAAALGVDSGDLVLDKETAMCRIMFASLPVLSCAALLSLGGCALSTTSVTPAPTPAHADTPHMLGHDVIASNAAPAAIGPYSQAIKSGPMLFLSGQIALDPKTGQIVAGDIAEQTKQVLENLQAVLAANGMGTDDVVATTVYLKHLNDFSKLKALYGSYFTSKAPARATVQVARLPRDALVEISAVAVK